MDATNRVAARQSTEDGPGDPLVQQANKGSQVATRALPQSTQLPSTSRHQYIALPSPPVRERGRVLSEEVVAALSARMAAKDIDATLDLGSRYYQCGEWGLAVQCFEVAANVGNPVGQNWLGVCCYEGHGVTRDCERAARLFFLAAQEKDSETPGYGPAQLNLARSFYYGLGVTSRNEGMAEFWAGKAAAQGFDFSSVVDREALASDANDHRYGALPQPRYQEPPPQRYGPPPQPSDDSSQLVLQRYGPPPQRPEDDYQPPPPQRYGPPPQRPEDDYQLPPQGYVPPSQPPLDGDQPPPKPSKDKKYRP